MARIIAVADSYDAMSSDRPYRKGLTVARLEEILKDGAGIQWDPNVVAAYFNIRDDVTRICASYSPSDGYLLDHPRSPPAAHRARISGSAPRLDRSDQRRPQELADGI